MLTTDDLCPDADVREAQFETCLLLIQFLFIYFLSLKKQESEPEEHGGHVLFLLFLLNEERWRLTTRPVWTQLSAGQM